MMLHLLETTSVMTEDNRNIVLWVILAAIAGAGLVITGILSAKNKRNQTDDDEDSDDDA